MDVPFIIDKSIYKVMKYLYRHGEVKLRKIERRFNEDLMNAALHLCPEYYAVYRDESKHLTFDITYTSTNGSIGLTPLGNKYVEDRREAYVKRFVPLVTSSISVAISLMALAFSIFLK